MNVERYYHDSKEDANKILVMTPKANSFCYDGNNDLNAHDMKLLQEVSTETREQMIQKQKDAALRRRKQQLRSSFIQSISSTETRVIDSDPHYVPTVKTYSFSSKVDSVNMNNKRQVSKVDVGVTKNQVDHANYVQMRNRATSSFTFQECKVIDSEANNEDERCISNRQRHFERSPSNVSSMSSSRSITDDIRNERMQNQVKHESNRLNSSILDNENVIEVCSDDETDDGKSICMEDNKTPQNVWGNIDWTNVEEMKRILLAPCPKHAGSIKCYIRRSKGKSKLFPEYRVYLKDGDTFLMTSKKRAKKQSSNYLISVERNDHEKESSNIIGKLRANFLGTEFQIYDNGKNPKHSDPFYDEKNNDIARLELGSILYSSNILGNRRPRKMQVCINRLDKEGRSTKKWQPACKEEEMLQNFKHRTKSALQHLYLYESRQPKWNEDIGSFVLNFNNRVNLASVKNFQLIDPNDNSNIVLQFGKAKSDEFIMDVQWPMSLFQAFAICLSSFDSKIACD